jgi:hypothetical protein
LVVDLALVAAAVMGLAGAAAMASANRGLPRVYSGMGLGPIRN